MLKHHVIKSSRACEVITKIYPIKDYVYSILFPASFFWSHRDSKALINNAEKLTMDVAILKTTQ